jgi:triphosphoribosyl-dephospho-CoA synthase
MGGMNDLCFSDVAQPCHAWPERPYAAPRPDKDNRAFCNALGRMATISLYDELSLYPKPGLVSLVDNGSHDDMTAATFFRSLFSLRHYFVQMAEAGLRQQRFPVLKALGVLAEKRMMRATGGVNTHRGAIFAVGLLCAAAGACRARNLPLSAPAIRFALENEWGTALLRHAQEADGCSHGLQVAKCYAASGARQEAALGMPSVFDVALPSLDTTFARTGCWKRARVDALFALMACISDTNVYYRGGAGGALLVKARAADFLARGGTSAADWQQYAIDCHRQFVDRKLSPGGAADLLGAACFVFKTTQRFGTAGIQTMAGLRQTGIATAGAAR